MLNLSKKLHGERIQDTLSQAQVQSHEQDNNFLRYDQNSMELDVIEQFKFNIRKLDDVQARLGFMNSELEKVIGSHRKLKNL